MNEHMPQQKILGQRGLIIFLILNNMFLTLSLDMYLPALPSMSVLLNTTKSITNLTLTVFIFAYAASSFVWGPLSDKLGRRPCLLAGTALYAISSLLCGMANQVYLLIALRIVQGFSAGGVLCISVAVVKDCYSGPLRERMLAIIYTASSMAMVIAPVLGAQLLRFFSWHAAFYVLALVGLLSFALSACYQETQPATERYHGSVWEAGKKFGVLFRNKSFFYLTLIFAASNLPFMGYVALSSYIYIDQFALSEQAYSIYFAICSVLYLVGPTLYIKFFSKRPKKKVGSGFFVLSMISGILVATVGRLAPLAFLLTFATFAILYSGVYTFYMSLILDQHQGDTGTASAMISAIVTTLGSIGTLLASLIGGDGIVGLGLLIIAFSLLPFIAWLAFLRSNLPCVGVKDQQ